MKKLNILIALLFLASSVFAQSTSYNTLGTWNSSGVPNYLESENDIVSSDLLARIKQSLPESKKLPESHPEYLADGVQTNVSIVEEADVWVTYVSEGAGYKNVLGFYTYDVNNPPTNTDDIENSMTIIFPNVSNDGSGGGLVPGNKVKIGVFQPGTVIGWFVLANGYKNGDVTDGNWRVFSDPNLNPESDPTLKQHNVLLNDGGKRFVLGFEDIRRDNLSCDQDFNDAVFYVTANPRTGIDTTGIPDVDNPNDDDLCLDYEVIFEGVQNDFNNNTSKWIYKVDAKNAAKDLSHWVVGLCDDHKVVSSSHDYEVPSNGDPTTGLYGIKWDVAVQSGKEKTFWFVLDGIYPVVDNFIAVKTGGQTKTAVCELLGPGCTTQISEVDIEINKEINTDCLNDGDQIKYTISAKNNGPDNATGVTVTDVLPLGLTNFSFQTSKGTFNFNTGVWTIGEMTNGSVQTLEIYATVDRSQITSGSVDLGPAKGYNVFVFDDLNQTSSDTEGKMAVGNNVTLSSYSVGDRLPTQGEDVLIVGNHLEFASGEVNNGNVVYGVSSNLPTANVSVHGTISQGTPIDFANSEVYLKNLSNSLTELLVNGSTTVEYSTLKLVGNDPNLNVFKVTKAELNATSEIFINTPNGATAIVNIEGNNINFEGGLTLNGTDIYSVIYNMPNTTNLHVSGIDVRGTILAPNADLDCPSGVINGQVIVKSVLGNCQFNLALFTGTIPGTDIKLVNTAFLSSVDQDDTDVNNDEAVVESEFCITSPPEKEVDLKLVKTASNNDCYKDSDQLVYNITLTNQGPDQATGVTVTDILPEGLVNVYPNASQGIYDIPSGLWSIGTIDAGSSVTLQINSTIDFESMDADDKEERELTNIAVVSSVIEKDKNPADNTSEVVITFCEEEAKVDIEVLKTVDKQNPQDGDQIKYTVKVTNKGPDNATGIVVTDQLPDGLANIDVVESQGSYVFATGIWNVGELASGASATMEVTATIDLEPVYTETIDLGPAKGFGLFVLRDVTQPSSDTEGKVAVGRNASFANYSVGDKLQNSNGTDDVLIVGGHLQFTSGDIYSGNVVYGKTTNLPIDQVGILHGTLRKDKPINFGEAKTYLIGLSNNLKGRIVNGTTEYKWSELILKGTDPFINVFKVQVTDLNKATNLKLTAPNGSVVIVNVMGDSIKWSGGLSVVGTSTSNVLFNFPKAKNIQINNIDVTGSILAPKAHLNYPSGVVNGQVICKSMEGAGQFNNVLFLGEIPGEGNIVNTASLTFVNELELNHENNSASVEVIIKHVYDGGNPDTGSDIVWESIAEFAVGEIIWTMSADFDGAPLAGTWGGNIYKFNGTEWVIINEDMGVGFIWSIAVDENSKVIYVSTERGVFASTNGGEWISIGLENNDTRALAVDNNGVLYAGTWGTGLFQYDGSTWTEIELEYPALAVHALAINSKNDLFVGTFGQGILKRSGDLGIWEKLEVGYDFIWALGVSSTDKIYAGTYGVGVIASPDDGDTWYVLNTGIDGDYVYSVSVTDLTVSVSTWTGGVYTIIEKTGKSGASFTSAEDFGEWKTFGLEGMGVSSLYTDIDGNTMYAGTKDGHIYKVVNGLTDANDLEEVIPTKFDLKQNYPNPFNPSTTIEFSIPKAGSYQLGIYNVLGQLVKTLANDVYKPGNYNVKFDASRFASGVYIYTLTGQDVRMVKKMMLLK